MNAHKLRAWALPGILVLFLAVLACTMSGVVPSLTPGAAAQVTPTQQVFLPTVTQPLPDGRLEVADFVYLGAFRLPDDGERPRTFEYGGNAMTFRPGDDPEQDGFSGSLFITGHDRLAYGELPDGSQVAEVSIPAPRRSAAVDELNTAAFLQGFQDVAAGRFTGLDEIPRIGMAYLDVAATGPKIHLAWGQHMPPEAPGATHAWIEPDLAAPDFQGEWWIGQQDFNAVNGYLFEISSGWAQAHSAGRPLATGRYRDGGWSGMGPALFAYQPWVDGHGTPAAPGASLPETVLLLYESSLNTPNIERSLVGYQHADEWEGGAWLTAAGKSAVVFAGTKGIGSRFWYGFANPAGPEIPCVAQDFVGQFTVCYQADGSPCPPEELVECAGHNGVRGWWSSHFQAEIILYDPADLARVAAGEIQAWEPQPYAVLDLEPVLFHNPSGVEPDMLGLGTQRRFRIGDIAYDRANGVLYVLELFADGAKPVIHVWRVG